MFEEVCAIAAACDKISKMSKPGETLRLVANSVEITVQPDTDRGRLSNLVSELSNAFPSRRVIVRFTNELR
jgi:hypothetical protein